MRILITGTSSGIGKGIAEKFLSEGHCVTGFDRKEATIQHTAYTHIHMDIRDKTHFPALEPFDIVINNAGVQNEEDIDVNLKGTIAITETYAIHPGIRAVLMIGSASGHNGSERPLLRQKRRPSHRQLRRYLQQPGFRRCPDRTEQTGHGRQSSLESDHGCDPFKALDDCRRNG